MEGTTLTYRHSGRLTILSILAILLALPFSTNSQVGQSRFGVPGACRNFPTPPAIVDIIDSGSANASVQHCADQCVAQVPALDRAVIGASLQGGRTLISCGCYNSARPIPSAQVDITGCDTLCPMDGNSCGKSTNGNLWTVYAVVAARPGDVNSGPGRVPATGGSTTTIVVAVIGAAVVAIAGVGIFLYKRQRRNAARRKIGSTSSFKGPTDMGGGGAMGMDIDMSLMRPDPSAGFGPRKEASAPKKNNLDVEWGFDNDRPSEFGTLQSKRVTIAVASDNVRTKSVSNSPSNTSILSEATTQMATLDRRSRLAESPEAPFGARVSSGPGLGSLERVIMSIGSTSDSGDNVSPPPNTAMQVVPPRTRSQPSYNGSNNIIAMPVRIPSVIIPVPNKNEAKADKELMSRGRSDSGYGVSLERNFPHRASQVAPAPPVPAMPLNYQSSINSTQYSTPAPQPVVVAPPRTASAVENANGKGTRRTPSLRIRTDVKPGAPVNRMQAPPRKASQPPGVRSTPAQVQAAVSKVLKPVERGYSVSIDISPVKAPPAAEPVVARPPTSAIYTVSIEEPPAAIRSVKRGPSPSGQRPKPEQPLGRVPSQTSSTAGSVSMSKGFPNGGIAPPQRPAPTATLPSLPRTASNSSKVSAGTSASQQSLPARTPIQIDEQLKNMRDRTVLSRMSSLPESRRQQERTPFSPKVEETSKPQTPSAPTPVVSDVDALVASPRSTSTVNTTDRTALGVKSFHSDMNMVEVQSTPTNDSFVAYSAKIENTASFSNADEEDEMDYQDETSPLLESKWTNSVMLGNSFLLNGPRMEDKAERSAPNNDNSDDLMLGNSLLLNGPRMDSAVEKVAPYANATHEEESDEEVLVVDEPLATPMSPPIFMKTAAPAPPPYAPSPSSVPSAQEERMATINAPKLPFPLSQLRSTVATPPMIIPPRREALESNRIVSPPPRTASSARSMSPGAMSTKSSTVEIVKLPTPREASPLLKTAAAVNVSTMSPPPRRMPPGIPEKPAERQLPTSMSSLPRPQVLADAVVSLSSASLDRGTKALSPPMSPPKTQTPNPSDFDKGVLSPGSSFLTSRPPIPPPPAPEEQPPPTPKKGGRKSVRFTLPPPEEHRKSRPISARVSSMVNAEVRAKSVARYMQAQSSDGTDTQMTSMPVRQVSSRLSSLPKPSGPVLSAYAIGQQAAIPRMRHPQRNEKVNLNAPPSWAQSRDVPSTSDVNMDGQVDVMSDEQNEMSLSSSYSSNAEADMSVSSFEQSFASNDSVPIVEIIDDSYISERSRSPVPESSDVVTELQEGNHASVDEDDAEEDFLDAFFDSEDYRDATSSRISYIADRDMLSDMPGDDEPSIFDRPQRAQSSMSFLDFLSGNFADEKDPEASEVYVENTEDTFEEERYREQEESVPSIPSSPTEDDMVDLMPEVIIPEYTTGTVSSMQLVMMEESPVTVAQAEAVALSYIIEPVVGHVVATNVGRMNSPPPIEDMFADVEEVQVMPVFAYTTASIVTARSSSPQSVIRMELPMDVAVCVMPILAYNSASIVTVEAPTAQTVVPVEPVLSEEVLLEEYVPTFAPQGSEEDLPVMDSEMLPSATDSLNDDDRDSSVDDREEEQGFDFDDSPISPTYSIGSELEVESSMPVTHEQSIRAVVDDEFIPVVAEDMEMDLAEASSAADVEPFDTDAVEMETTPLGVTHSDSATVESPVTPQMEKERSQFDMLDKLLHEMDSLEPNETLTATSPVGSESFLEDIFAAPPVAPLNEGMASPVESEDSDDNIFAAGRYDTVDEPELEDVAGPVDDHDDDDESEQEEPAIITDMMVHDFDSDAEEVASVPVDDVVLPVELEASPAIVERLLMPEDTDFPMSEDVSVTLDTDAGSDTEDDEDEKNSALTEDASDLLAAELMLTDAPLEAVVSPVVVGDEFADDLVAAAVAEPASAATSLEDEEVMEVAQASDDMESEAEEAGERMPRESIYIEEDSVLEEIAQAKALAAALMSDDPSTDKAENLSQYSEVDNFATMSPDTLDAVADHPILSPRAEPPQVDMDFDEEEEAMMAAVAQAKAIAMRMMEEDQAAESPKTSEPVVSSEQANTAESAREYIEDVSDDEDAMAAVAEAKRLAQAMLEADADTLATTSDNEELLPPPPPQKDAHVIDAAGEREEQEDDADLEFVLDAVKRTLESSRIIAGELCTGTDTSIVSAGKSVLATLQGQMKVVDRLMKRDSIIEVDPSMLMELSQLKLNLRSEIEELNDLCGDQVEAVDLRNGWDSDEESDGQNNDRRQSMSLAKEARKSLVMIEETLSNRRKSMVRKSMVRKSFLPVPSKGSNEKGTDGMRV
ncbi:hypothetical protein HDU85_006618 [Gaertneriomyces sp. JEL0708]|nr:hypothetical protein HDU85_006618 [Gaertneriomyces sp. JEL0708]